MPGLGTNKQRAKETLIAYLPLLQECGVAHRFGYWHASNVVLLRIPPFRLYRDQISRGIPVSESSYSVTQKGVFKGNMGIRNKQHIKRYVQVI
jgi:hypothetical protein